MFLWRLTRRLHADFTGYGGTLTNGRWHSRGQPVVYCACTAALAVLEVRVHLDLAPDELPDDYVLLKIAVPDDLEIRAISPAELPEWWRQDEDLCRPFGNRWLAERATAVLEVPSAIVDVERNALLNPLHPDAARFSVEETKPFGWDQRLFRERSST